MATASQEAEATADADSPAYRGELPRGASVGRYLVVECIGRGGMGVVYRAYDPELDRAVAIKLVRTDPRNPEHRSRLRARLIREAQTLAQLSHANVVSVFDVGPFGDGAFVAMELVDGDSLRNVLKLGRTPGDDAGEKVRVARILELFHDAGLGLAAAHAVGIIHRDFKPDNVIVGRDGVARVVDFGIARAIDDEASSRVGEVLGTPGYMAPEQIAGHEVDEGADQFSFCASLYEALYGARPLADPKTIAAKSRTGERVDARVRALLRRGLSGERTARYGAMTEVIAELEPPVRRRALWAGVAVAGGAIAIAVAALLANHRDEPSCEVAATRWDNVWDGPRRTQVHAAIDKATTPQMADSVARVIDRYVSDWTAMSTASCRASVAGEQSAELLDLRAACLGQRVAELSEMTSLLAAGDLKVARRSLDAVRSLSPIADCANTATLRDAVPPRHPEASAALRDNLARLRARYALAGYASVETDTTKLIGEAEAIDDRWLAAGARYLKGRAEWSQGHIEQAEDDLYKSVAAAEAGRASEISARSWITLAWIAGEDRHKPADGIRFAAIAQGIIDRIGGAPKLEAPLEDHLGVLYVDANKLDEARKHLERALELDRKLYGEDSEYATALSHLAILEIRAGRHDKAVELASRARTLITAELGDRHPDTLAITGTQGAELVELQRYPEAIALLEPAIARARPDSEIMASLLVNLGLAYWKTNALDKARDTFLRGLDITQRHDPDGDRAHTLQYNLGFVYDSYGHAALDAKRPAEAVTAFERELELLTLGGAEPKELAASRFALAQAIVEATHDKARARKLAESALVDLQAAHDADGVAEVTAWLAKH